MHVGAYVPIPIRLHMNVCIHANTYTSAYMCECVCEYVYINVLERCMPKRVSSTEKVFAEWNWNEGELESER